MKAAVATLLFLGLTAVSTHAQAAQTARGYGFPSNIENLFPLTEGSGNTVTDIIAGETATIVSGTAKWTADGALSFGSTSHPTNRMQAPGITSFLGMEVVFVPSNPSVSMPNIPIAYETASNANPGFFIGLYPGWNAWGPTPTVGNYMTYPGYQITPTHPKATGYTSQVGNQMHVLLLSIAPNSGRTTLYLDGVPALNPFNPNLFPGAAVAGGNLVFGGTTLGYQNRNNVYTGKIYGVATYSTSPSATDAQASYRAWMKVLASKHADTAQDAPSTAFHSKRSAVVLVSQGESITWGHGLAAPATSNYTYYASKQINGGNNLFFANGRDADNAYVMAQGSETFNQFYEPGASNVALLFTNANGCKNGGGAPIDPHYTGSSHTIAEGEVANLQSETTYLHKKGWIVLWATGTSGNYGTKDIGKDACNLVLRKAAGGPRATASTPDALFDIATHAWFGADGAYTDRANSAVCSGGPVYLPDTMHPTACGQSVIGSFLATLVNRLLYPTTPTITGTTASLTGQETQVTLNAGGAKQTITLPDCIGLTYQKILFKSAQTNGGSATTLVPAAPPSPIGNYVPETIDGQNTLSIQSGSTTTLTAIAGADATAGCMWSTH